MKKVLGALFFSMVAVVTLGATDASAEQVRNEYFWDADTGRVDVDVYTWTYDEQISVVLQTDSNFGSYDTVVANLQRYTTANGWYFIGTGSESMYKEDIDVHDFNPYPSHEQRQWATWRFEIKVYDADTGQEIARHYTGSFMY